MSTFPFNYTVGHKNTPNFFYKNLKKSDQILISFGTNRLFLIQLAIK